MVLHEEGNTGGVNFSDGVVDATTVKATSIEVGAAATDTTITRKSAGILAVEGNEIYASGGTDVSIGDGGTGASTAAAARVALLPSLTGNAGKKLQVNVGEADVE